MNKSKDSLKKNSLLNIIKQCCSIMFPLITFPYISRILGSENYGKYSMSNSIIYYFILLASFGISNYAIREGAKIRNDKKRWEVFSNQIFSINIITSIFSLLLLLLLLQNNEIKKYERLLLIQSIIIIFNALGADWVNSVYEDYVYITIRYIVCQILSLFLMFLLVREKNDYYVYTAIMALASAGGNFLNIFYIRRYVKLKFTLKIDWKEHFSHIIYFFINSLAIAVYVNSDIVILGYLRTESEVGLYTLAGRIYSLLKMLINAIITVAIPRVAYLIAKDKKQYLEISNKIFLALFSILLPACTGLFCLAEEAMLIVGGEEYIAASNTLKILCVAMFFAIGASFFANVVLIIFNKEKIVLQATILAAFANIILNFGMIRYFGMEGAAITTVLAECIYCLIVCLESKMYWKYMFDKKCLLACCIGSIAIFINCNFLRSFNFGLWLFLVIVILTSVILYIGILTICRHPMIESELNKRKGGFYGKS